MFITTGLHDLDEWFGGWYRGRHHIIAGRPMMGKSTCVYNFTLNAGAANQKVLLVSSETNAEGVAGHMLSIRAGVPYIQMIRGQLNNDEYKQVELATAQIKQYGIHVTEQFNLPNVRKLVAKLKSQNGLDLVFVDNLSRSEGQGEEFERMQMASAELSSIAKTFDVAVVSTAYVNRKVEQRKDKRPHLSDVKYLSAIENHASFIMLLYLDVIYDIQTPLPGLLEVIIAKNEITGITGESGIYLDPTSRQLKDSFRKPLKE